MIQRASRGGHSTLLACLVTVVLVLLGSILTPAHAQLSPGDALVIDFNAGTGSLGALFRLDPMKGARTLVSDFGNPAQGPLSGEPIVGAVEASGQILVTDIGTASPSALLLRVNPTNGIRTVVSDFGTPLRARWAGSRSGWQLKPPVTSS